MTPNTALRAYIHLIAWALRTAALRGLARGRVETAARVEELARQLPQPPAPPPAPDATQRATLHAFLVAGRLWDRYRDPLGSPGISAARRPDAMLIAATLGDEDVRWLAQQITLEFVDGPDQPPVSHEVYQ